MTATDQQNDTSLARETGSSASSLGLLVLRLFVGLGMAAHGAQKLFNFGGGGGIDATADYFEALGFEPSMPYAVLSGLVELGGGLFIALGLALPFAAAAVVANMTGAYAAIQAGTDADFFAGGGGPELELFYICAAFALILTGPGRLAVRIPALDGPKMRMLGVVLAIAGGIGAVVVYHL